MDKCGAALIKTKIYIMKAMPLISYLFFLLVSVCYLFGAFKLPFGTAAQPGSGFFPLLTGIALSIITSVLVVTSFLRFSKNTDVKMKEFPAGNDLYRVVTLIIVFIFFALLLKWTGFVFCSFFTLAITFKVFGLKDLHKIFIISLIFSICFFFFFSSLLEVPLPVGTLFFINTSGN